LPSSSQRHRLPCPVPQTTSRRVSR
jgi:hypothetical protein